MAMTTPELSRAVRIDTLGETARALTVEATAEERDALARRFRLVAIPALAAEVELVRTKSSVRAQGQLRAKVIQSCVATGEPIEAAVDEPFDIKFRPTPDGARPDEEVELSEAEMDVVFYDGASIDIGEAVAETLSLSLDPYPRSSTAKAALESAGVKSEEEAGPFGALAALRDKLKK
jgi:uncharacterized metal-binding protein YceD (DUF177 family)